MDNKVLWNIMMIAKSGENIYEETPTKEHCGGVLNIQSIENCFRSLGLSKEFIIINTKLNKENKTRINMTSKQVSNAITFDYIRGYLDLVEEEIYM